MENVRATNRGPLPDAELHHIFERIIDVMRNLQKEEIQPKAKAAAGDSAAAGRETEFDLEVND